MAGSDCIFACLMSMAFWYLILPLIVGASLRWTAKWLMAGGKMKTGGKTMVILGSGGHTREILSMSKALSMTFNPRIYVSARSDQRSLDKAREFEEQRKEEGKEAGFHSVVRIRDVGQSYLSALLSRVPKAFLQSVMLMIKERPDILFCNGPGVCVIFSIVATILNILRVSDTRIVYVESLCRVKTLSLSGRIMIRLAHDFVVQWKDLQVKCQAEYPGVNVVFMGRLS